MSVAEWIVKVLSKPLAWIIDEVLDIVVSVAFYFTDTEYRRIMDEKRRGG